MGLVGRVNSAPLDCTQGTPALSPAQAHSAYATARSASLGQRPRWEAQRVLVVALCAGRDRPVNSMCLSGPVLLDSQTNASQVSRALSFPGNFLF